MGNVQHILVDFRTCYFYSSLPIFVCLVQTQKLSLAFNFFTISPKIILSGKLFGWRWEKKIYSFFLIPSWDAVIGIQTARLFKVRWLRLYICPVKYGERWCSVQEQQIIWHQETYLLAQDSLSLSWKSPILHWPHVPNMVLLILLG